MLVYAITKKVSFMRITSGSRSAEMPSCMWSWEGVWCFDMVVQKAFSNPVMYFHGELSLPSCLAVYKYTNISSTWKVVMVSICTVMAHCMVTAWLAPV